jgi:hypothetical protein
MGKRQFGKVEKLGGTMKRRKLAPIKMGKNTGCDFLTYFCASNKNGEII